MLRLAGDGAETQSLGIQGVEESVIFGKWTPAWQEGLEVGCDVRWGQAFRPPASLVLGEAVPIGLLRQSFTPRA